MTSRSWADDPYIPQVVPQCTKFVVPSVGTVCGYLDLEDWKAVLKADAELVESREVLRKQNELTAALVTQAKSLQDQVDILTSSKKVLVERNAKLEADYLALDEKYQNERVKPRWGTPLAWSVAAVATAVLTGVLVYQAMN